MSSFTFTFAAESVTLAAGQYHKVSIAGVDGKKTNKTGTAFLTVADNGSAHYTNRRGEVEGPLIHKRVLAILRTGINTLMVDVEESLIAMALELNMVEADALTHADNVTSDDFRLVGNCLNYGVNA